MNSLITGRETLVYFIPVSISMFSVAIFILRSKLPIWLSFLRLGPWI